MIYELISQRTVSRSKIFHLAAVQLPFHASVFSRPPRFSHSRGISLVLDYSPTPAASFSNLLTPFTAKGPEIRTGFLKDEKPIRLQQGQEITISTDYNIKGDEEMISMSYKKLAQDMKPGGVILCADGTITLTVLSCDEEQGLVRCRCENSATLGERKNVNLPGIVVDLPTLTQKDKEDILQWGVPNKIDIIALSFVRKGSDLVEVRELLGGHSSKIILLILPGKTPTCLPPVPSEKTSVPSSALKNVNKNAGDVKNSNISHSICSVYTIPTIQSAFGWLGLNPDFI